MKNLNLIAFYYIEDKLASDYSGIYNASDGATEFICYLYRTSFFVRI